MKKSVLSHVTLWLRLFLSATCRLSAKQYLLVCIYFVGVYFLLKLLPRPTWLCGQQELSPALAYQRMIIMKEMMKSDRPTKNELARGPDENSYLLKMYPLYFNIDRSKDDNNLSKMKNNYDENEPGSVNQFLFKNFDFRDFGRRWVNDIPSFIESNVSSFHEKKIENSINSSTGADIDLQGVNLQVTLTNKNQNKLQYPRHQELPDCLRMRVLEEATPTRICVHKPDVDNFISNRLRDTGIWEKEYALGMAKFFQNRPMSQLVDLGCNVGVFTLFAASLGIPSLAVDILPANLALIQLSIATTDALNDDLDLRHLDLLEYIVQTGKNQPSLRDRRYNGNITNTLDNHGFGSSANSANAHRSSRYSDLITTFHNAVYSRRTKMRVHLKDNDLNLGGTEVKELDGEEKQSGASPTFQSRTLQSTLEDRSDTRKETFFERRRRKRRPSRSRNVRALFQRQVVKNREKHKQSYMQPKSGLMKPTHFPRIDTSQASPGISSHEDDLDESERIQTKPKEKAPKVLTVDAICLDDLLPYLWPDRGVFLKMDVEGSEPEIFKCASRFFSTADVRIVMMEIAFHKYSPSVTEMTDFLLRYNLVPSKDPLGLEGLDLDNFWSWPENVFWVRAR